MTWTHQHCNRGRVALDMSAISNHRHSTALDEQEHCSEIKRRRQIRGIPMRQTHHDSVNSAGKKRTQSNIMGTQVGFHGKSLQRPHRQYSTVTQGNRPIQTNFLNQRIFLHM